MLLATLLFIGCDNSKTEEIKTNDYATIDSLIGKSEQNLSVVGGANKKSDSLVTGKVEKTVKKIKKMENEIKELKQENNELKNQLDDNNDAGEPFIIRTISDNQDY